VFRGAPPAKRARARGSGDEAAQQSEVVIDSEIGGTARHRPAINRSRIRPGSKPSLSLRATNPSTGVSRLLVASIAQPWDRR